MARCQLHQHRAALVLQAPPWLQRLHHFRDPPTPLLSLLLPLPLLLLPLLLLLLPLLSRRLDHHRAPQSSSLTDRLHQRRAPTPSTLPGRPPHLHVPPVPPLPQQLHQLHAWLLLPRLHRVRASVRAPLPPMNPMRPLHHPVLPTSQLPQRLQPRHAEQASLLPERQHRLRPPLLRLRLHWERA